MQLSFLESGRIEELGASMAKPTRLIIVPGHEGGQIVGLSAVIVAFVRRNFKITVVSQPRDFFVLDATSASEKLLR